MYYTTASPDFRAAMCVADSTDGFHWTRPELGIHEFRRSKRNNIVLTHCRCVSVSKDGYHWTEGDVVVPYPPNPQLHQYQLGREGTRALAGTDVHYLWPCKVNGEFVVTYKEDGSLARRSVGMSRGADFKSFSDTRIILRSDLLDPPDVQYHGMVGFPYGDLYLGLAERWFGAPTHFEIMLVWSHDLDTLAHACETGGLHRPHVAVECRLDDLLERRPCSARGDTDAATIRWPGDRSMRELAGREVRLAIFMRDAHLYSFRSTAAQT